MWAEIDCTMQQGKGQQLQSWHRRGPKTVLVQTAGITKCQVILVVFFKFWIKSTCGEDFNQFVMEIKEAPVESLMEIPWFWCIICLCSWIRSYLPQKQYWWNAMAVHSNCSPLIPYLYYPWYDACCSAQANYKLVFNQSNEADYS